MQMYSTEQDNLYPCRWTSKVLENEQLEPVLARRKTTNIKNNNPLDVAKQYGETYSLSFSATRDPEERLEIKINKLMISQLYIAAIIIKARMTQISLQNPQVIVPKYSTDDTPSCRQNNGVIFIIHDSLGNENSRFALSNDTVFNNMNYVFPQIFCVETAIKFDELSNLIQLWTSHVPNSDIWFSTESSTNEPTLNTLSKDGHKYI